MYGKIKSIQKTDGSSLLYKYDASGNRVCKIHTKGSAVIKTWYVRDAQGNVLAVYEQEGNSPLKWKEQHLYGSSRLGVWNVDIDANTTDIETPWYTSVKRYYELTNHLGNVLATVADDGNVLSASDYYPFGMPQRGRGHDFKAYRYGFNGKENDGEVKGDGIQYDYGFRIYDARLARFLSTDPLFQSYPWYTPYQFAGNKPIVAIDLDGLEEFVKTDWHDATGKVYPGAFSPAGRSDEGDGIRNLSEYAKERLKNID
ncbi:hypothetical protein MKQ70_14930 [Chitinophaga sedimenti]|uniref:RHS repeat domain-containing protein n=1 Tax=Chitinophaga sedimenti TaxID=2033606 RepID=UPI00200365E1|nr:RHS repeat-associated core domain-containing protein [Chitinophaga sedimenti]MCK7556238.1 hypothetical protein [Chitinophaga sedimenti]